MTNFSCISSKLIIIFALLVASLPFVAFKAIPLSKHSDYSVTFVNKYWTNFHLQVRVGNNSNPVMNNIYYDGNLAHGYQLVVPYDVLCWYRRDANPNNPDGVHFTAWTSAGCFRNSPCTVDNP